MHRRFVFLALLVAPLLASGAVPESAPQPTAATEVDAAARLAERIDQRLDERRRAAGVKPAAAIDDAAFLRRVSLDLIGRIPTVYESRTYIADKSADKDRKLVRRLLASPLYARHWATLWRRRWIPEADAPQFEFLVDDVDDWLAAKLHRRTSYREITAELLNGPSGKSKIPGDESGARAFLVAGEDKPENLAAHATRAFLGINLDCAQCHDHPFARWTRDEFWQTAAFFARPTPVEPTTDEKGSPAARFTVVIPDTERRVSAKFLSDPRVAWPTTIDRDTGRRTLAEWITSPQNPYFARHAANYVWLNLFGNGLVLPLDDLSVAAPQGDPQLLAELADELIAADFDVARIVEACVLTKSYRLGHHGATSAKSDAAQPSPIHSLLFAEMPIRALMGEQLYDSIRTAAGLSAVRDDLARREALLERRTWGRQFLSERAATAERSILQALKLMNGPTVAAAGDPDLGPLITTAVDGPLATPEDRVNLIFAATLNRAPTADERAAALAHLAAGKAAPRRAVSDLFWALVNTAEFNTNH